jgi:hypothetical protein
MIKRKILLPAIFVSVMTLMMVGLPAKTLAQGSSANFIFINYIGREMTFDLDDVTYIIPGTDTVPQGGRLALQLPAGEHKFAANIPAVAGSAGEFTIPPGGYVAKAARLEKTPPALAHDGTILAKPKDFVLVFDFDPFAEPIEEAVAVDTWQPAAAGPGQASLVFVNYTRDELTVDINSQAYKVAPPDKDIPGRFQLDLPPGAYRFTVSVPGGSLNGEVMMVAGAVTGLNVTADLPPEREFKIGEKYEFLLPVTLHLFQEDFTGRAGAVAAPVTPDLAPATLPASGAEATAPAPPVSPAVAEGLLIKNFAGDTLTFTINNQAYSIADRGELALSLAPGSYTYTASRPYVATTGAVNLQPGQGIELSIAINVGGDILSVYQN